MEWVKFFVESYVQFIGHIAWPLLIMAILFIFRKPIAEKIRGLKKVSKGDTIAEFIATTDLQKVVSEKLTLANVNENTLNWSHYLDVLEVWAGFYGLYALELVSKDEQGLCKDSEVSWAKEILAGFSALVEKIAKECPESSFFPELREVEDRLQSYKGFKGS